MNVKKQNEDISVVHKAAAIACVLEDENEEAKSTAVVKDYS